MNSSHTSHEEKPRDLEKELQANNKRIGISNASVTVQWKVFNIENIYSQTTKLNTTHYIKYICTFTFKFAYVWV